MFLIRTDVTTQESLLTCGMGIKIRHVMRLVRGGLVMVVSDGAYGGDVIEDTGD